MFKKSLFICLLSFFLSASFIYGQDSSSINSNPEEITINTDSNEVNLNFGPEETGSVSQDTGYSAAGAFFKMILVLIIVILIIYGLSRLFKKFTVQSNNEDPFLRVVSEVKLAPGKTVNVITLLNKAYIIGVTDGAINVIGQVEDEELINAMNLHSDQKSKTEKPRSFAEILNIFMPGGTKDENVFNSENSTNSEFLNAQINRLNENEEQ